jgi:hypothetical protein
MRWGASHERMAKDAALLPSSAMALFSTSSGVFSICNNLATTNVNDNLYDTGEMILCVMTPERMMYAAMDDGDNEMIICAFFIVIIPRHTGLVY